MITTLEPPYAEWGSLLQRNRDGLAARAERLGAERVRSIRQAVYEAALSYSASLAEVAHSIGLSGDLPAKEAFDFGDPLVMAGHQPVIYHQGLLFKNECLSRFSRESGAKAINVIIDTDEGDAGRIVWPLRAGDALTLRSDSLSTCEGIFSAQQVVSAERTREIFESMSADLVVSGLPDAASSVCDVSKLYQALAGQPIAVANSLVRWQRERRAYLEVPLSHLVTLPMVRDLLLSWVHDYEELASVYNVALNSYRSDHRIKNPANPFPNMRVDSAAVELPLWLMGAAGREPLRIESGKAFEVPEDKYVAPRGSIVTLLLRGFCSDLFVHGKGGGKYDRFVDRFAELYLGVSLPQFVVASSTRYAFPERLARFEDAIALKARYKEIVSHTEKFTGCGLFTSDEEKVLTEYVHERSQLLSRLKTAESPESRSAVAHALNALNKQIKQTIDASSLTEKLSDAQVPEVVLARWRYREYPFFMLEEQ